MNTQQDALTTLPRPATAANEDFQPRLDEKTPAGWDAFEVWRTRVKAQQEKPQPPRLG